MRYSAQCLLFVICLAVAVRAEEVRPNAPSSHEAFLKVVTASRDRTRKEIVAQYDAYLAASPGDHLTAIERCKFLLAGTHEDDEDEEDTPTPVRCGDELEARYAEQGAVVLYRMGTMWGTKALDYGARKLADPGITFTRSERASLLGLMARQQHARTHLKEAGELAERAQQEDPTYDGTFVIADFLHSIGQRQKALAVLSTRLGDDHKPSSLLEKARLLSELDDPARALAAIRAATANGATYIDPALEGRALEALGDTEGARAVYAKQKGWKQREVLTRLFYLDLGKKTQAEATASYKALRDLGWRADPLARHRLALSAMHPGAPWMLRDVAGLFGLVATIFFAAMLPLAIALPVHYVGLLRRARGAVPVDSRWTLRHACAACGLMLVGSLLALYGFAYEELDTFFDDGNANLSQLQIARAGVISFTFTVLATIPFTRRSDWKKLAPNAWMNHTTVVTAAKYFVLLLVIAWLNRILILAFTAAAPSAEGVAMSTLAALRAIRDTYGVSVMIFFAVLTAPLSEEFIFRGVMLDGLSRHLPMRLANFVQAGLFALMHDNLKMAPFLIAVGVIAGILRRRTQSLATGMVLHSLNNLVALAAIPV